MVLLCVPIVLLIVADKIYGEELLQSLDGIVGAENYTYYRLSRQGHLRIEMESLEGDADLYVSDKTGSPNFEDFTQESVTCGLDVVEIPASYNRPVGIGIYGYPSKEIARYRISIILVSETDDASYDQLMAKYYNYERSAAFHTERDSDRTDKQSTARVMSPEDEEEEEDEGSLLWQILITLLKVFFEIVF